ncbi:MAG: hypothetical protein JWN71_2808 [Xanthobacteraceae bacterium]|nr:hypothetical protein [Xanthobacteraceae bacterium]
MTKRLLLLTTAVGLILGTAAIAQNPTEPSKPDTNKPAAQQTDKNAKPMSRIEKWQADKQTEAAEKTIDKNTGTPANTAQGNAPAKPATNAQTPAAAPAASTNAQSQTPASNTATSAQSPAPNAATKAAPAPVQAQTNTPNTNTATPPAQTNTATQAQPSAAQPNAAPAQAQTPNAAPAANQQAQQPPNTTTPTANTNAATSNTSASAQTTISAGVSVTDPQRTRISESVARLKVEPLKNVSFSISVGTVIPRDVRLHPVPAEVVEIVPQYRDYRFFTVREEIVIVEPSTMKIVTVLPRNGGSTASTTTSTQTSSMTPENKSRFSDRDRAAFKKHASQPRRERTTTSERDDPRSARAESRELRVGDRLPDAVELRDMPQRAYREAPALRDYRYIQRGSRTYVIEPRERTVIEQFD